ncbi:MAG: hypothetical protein KAT77_06245 [Nanoarchaeota archaeon]|nr:hypothetical protein [Nanoarchaeota archaeon]
MQLVKEGSIDTKVKDNKKEIDQAISGQYDNKDTVIEITPTEYGSENKPIGTDGAYEHQYGQEHLGLKVDYSKLWEHMGQKKEPAQNTEETSEKPEQVEERKGDMEIIEMMETMDEIYVESAIPSGGSHVDYESKEGLDYALQTSPHKLVWFKFWEESSPWRDRNRLNVSKHNHVI